MKIGIKGQSFSGKPVRIYFERVPGSHEPQIRITTEDGAIYLPEADFITMFGQLFSNDPNYVPRHGRAE